MWTQPREERNPAWATVGKNVEGLTIDEALVASGIDFPVVARPVNVVVEDYEGGPTRILHDPDSQVIYREDRDKILSFVGKRYRVVQTRQVVNLIEELVGGGWEPLYGGIMRGGRQVFLVGSLPFETTHGIDPYLAFVNSFDGTTGVRLAMTPIRVRCMNAVRRTFRQTRSSVSLRHTKWNSESTAEIRDALGLAKSYYARLDADIAALMNLGLTELRMEQALNALYPIDNTMNEAQIERRKAKHFEVSDNLRLSPTIEEHNRETVWGLWNSVSELEQWGLIRKNPFSLLGAQLGTNTITLQSDRLFRLIDTWK